MVKEDDERGFILKATDSTYAKNQLDNRSGCKQSELILDGTAGEY